ncbi:FAD/NAD-P-binding domain-containing protein [Multifurca ochricompacta]|uniref:FAD/NAD-P-binding domain-containing protein n=1 Tax=Multifurca ochricompacta TaxID=376703 RepID=A0AAD4MDK4_9AGAM|nr:FAD/NAD-P-binding domain-containing protein [Multifurca ochricompacta]
MTVSKKRVVIVGGGCAGIQLCSALVKKKKLNPQVYTLTLITARPFFVHLPATIRTTTTGEGSLEERIFIPYSNLFKDDLGEVKIGRVKSIQGRKTGGGQLVLLDGSSSTTMSSCWRLGTLGALKHVQEWRQKFEHAKSIVIVGGGITGVEFAGEIRDFHPKTDVTLVHPRTQLLNEAYPDKFRKRVHDDIAFRGVGVVWNDYIDNLASVNGSVTTRSGHTIQGDLVLPCYGGRPATDFVSALDPAALDDHGYIRVKPTLELISFLGIFAMGDAISWPEVKNVIRARAHADIVASNIIAYLNNSAALTYKGKIEMVVVTNGRTHGVSFFGVLWGIVLGNWFSALVKGRELLVTATRRDLGFKS